MKASLEIFSRQTVLHGFSFILYSRSVIERFLYATMIVLSVAMMIRDAISLITKYNSEPTKIDLFTMHNKTFDLGQPTICLVPTSFEGDDSTDSAFDIRFFAFNKTTEQMNWIDNMVAFSEASQLLDEWLAMYQYNISSISENIKSWDNEEWDAFYNETDKASVLALIYHTSASILATEYNLLINHTTNPFTVLGQTELVRQRLIEKRVNFRDLMDLTALIACRKAKIKYYMFGELQENSSFCETSDLTWTGITDIIYARDESPKFCYKFPKVWKFRKTVDFINIEFQGIHNKVLGEIDRECRIYLDFAGERGYFSRYSQATGVRIRNNIQIAKVSMNSEILSYNSVRKPCGEGRKVDCILNCLQGYFIANYSCLPVSIMTDNPKPSNMSYCTELPLLSLDETLANYSAGASPLRDWKTAIDSDDYCASLCIEECSTRQLTVLIPQADAVKSDTYPCLAVYVSSFIYPFFVESLLLTWSDVLMSFGGSIGFWFGASIIAFAHAVLFFLAHLAANVSWLSQLKASSSPGQPNLKNEY